MLLSTIVAALPLLTRNVNAMPIERRALSSNDTNTLQLALYLEHLEYALYSGGFNNFSDAQYTAAGFPAGFRTQVGVIRDNEATHAAELSSLLSASGVTPVPTCTYMFSMSTDPKSFVSLANMITTVGIGAYLGGGLNLVDNSTLLGIASSILTNEARHDTFLRTGIGAAPFPTPYDTSLTALWAYSLAQAFVVSCPQPLPITPLPKLKVVSPTPPASLQPPVPTGTKLTFNFDPTTFFVPVKAGSPLYIAFINQIAPPVFVPLNQTCGTGCGTVALPAGIGGVAFAVLTTFSGGLTAAQLSSFGTLAGPAEVALA